MAVTRPTWDNTWLAVARDVAARSLCVRDQVGAVIVDSRNRIIATGYNGPPTGFPHNDEKCDRWCSRANPTWEWATTDPSATPVSVDQDDDGVLTDRETGQTIDDPYLFFTSRGYRKIEHVSPCYDDCSSAHAEINALSVCDRSVREGGTLYVTSQICFQCAKVIANSGVATVVTPAEAPLAEHRDPSRSYEFLERCGISVVTA